MSTSFKLSLPTDIPWRRKCVSEDMLDRKLCDPRKLYRWRSSIAVFEYEPEEENQLYEGLRISYLKVACTITGYQERAEEIGLDPSGVRSYWKKNPGIGDYLNTLTKYYPCHGAVLEVTVGPENAEQTALLDYPYFLDFEPKKRELFELVTTTGEVLSRSLTGVEVGKSASSARQHEVVDIDKGWSASAEVKVGAVGVGGSASRQGEWGTRDITKSEVADVRNVDASQESRETLSHTTQLTQMYHQLNSYHTGTNRAVFFMLPRPHVVQSENTFVNGPRLIEGVQEFFLVVARPKDMERICVEAYLETGHIAKDAFTAVEEIPGTEIHTTWSDAYAAAPKGDDDETTVFDAADRLWDVNTHNPGYKIKNATLTGGPVTLRYNYDKPNLVDVHPHISDINDDFIRVSGKVHSGFANYVVDSDRYESIHYPFRVDITLVKKQAVQRSTDTLFITGRRLCCCGNPLLRGIETGVVYEKAMSAHTYAAQASRGEGMPIQVANQITDAVRESMIGSRNDVENRYESYVSLATTQFAVRSLVHGLGNDQSNGKLSEQENIPEHLRRQLSRFSHRLTVREALNMPPKMLRDLIGMSEEDSIELRKTLTGVANTTYRNERAWLDDKQIDSLFARDNDAEVS